ncbi:hypothetical protein [Micromonospora sp. WMMD736]|uniref:hypothetical protein n=1 Tax=Micromonospora sp. WMMD736 TaxID=3404112 RepID=UPI003B93EF60
MKKILGLAASAALASAALWGAGTAVAAPDVVGEPYSDAASEIVSGGGSAHVAVRVGSRLPQDDCIVTNAWDRTFTRPMIDDVYYEQSSGEVNLALNCNGDHATATNAGTSVGNPAGREAKLAAEQSATEEESELAEVSSPGF